MHMLNRISRQIVIALAIGYVYSWAIIIHVPGDQPTIQTGINASANGDTVLVAPGVYFENINFREKGITVASHFLINSNPACIDSTIINGSAPADPDTASCVLIVSDSAATALDTTAALIGFTISGGSGTKWLDEHGAGTYREAGGILIQYLSPVIRNNFITGNDATDTQGVTSAGGGAMRIGDGNPRIINNIIKNNSGLYGGAIVLNYTGAVIANNVIAYNHAANAYGGGNIWTYGSGPSGTSRLIENNAIVNNGTSGACGGIYRGAWTAVHNTILWGNQGTQISGAAGSVTYCDVMGGFSGTGNIDTNPAFADTVHFYLTAPSPCVDAGDTSVQFNDPEDPGNTGQALWPSLGGLRNDMGAYGGPRRADLPNAVLENNGHKSTGSLIVTPNPFRTTTIISFAVTSPTGTASLLIFNTCGQLVRSFSDLYLPGDGRIAVTWKGTDNNGKKVPAGIYLGRLQTGRETAHTVIVRLK